MLYFQHTQHQLSNPSWIAILPKRFPRSGFVEMSTLFCWLGQYWNYISFFSMLSLTYHFFTSKCLIVALALSFCMNFIQLRLFFWRSVGPFWGQPLSFINIYTRPHNFLGSKTYRYKLSFWGRQSYCRLLFVNPFLLCYFQF